jgi:hypothetical protein
MMVRFWPAAGRERGCAADAVPAPAPRGRGRRVDLDVDLGVVVSMIRITDARDVPYGGIR